MEPIQAQNFRTENKLAEQKMEADKIEFRYSKRGLVIAILVMIVILLVWASCDKLFNKFDPDRPRVEPAVMVAGFSEPGDCFVVPVFAGTNSQLYNS